MIAAFGGEWRRNYTGGESQAELDDIRNYTHSVWFPSDETCKRLNFDAWD